MSLCLGAVEIRGGFFMCLTPVIRNYCFFGFFPLTPLIVATAPLFLPYILRCNTPQCCGTRQGRRVLVFSILALPFIFTPSFFYGYFPYRQGGRIEMLFLIFFSIPSPFGPLPYIFALQKHSGGGRAAFLVSE